MAATTHISWTDATFNPWIGCSRVHTGCLNCYAEADQDTRKGRVKWGPNGTRSRTSDAYWREPLKWNKAAECYKTFDCVNGSHSDACPQSSRPRVFCASLADVFEDWNGQVLDHRGMTLWQCDGLILPNVGPPPSNGDAWQPVTLTSLRRDLFCLIDATPNIDWLLLTKRPENILRMWPFYDDVTGGERRTLSFDEPNLLGAQMHRPNVWLGTSISDQATADKAIPNLLRCRDLSPVLFLSIEPLLGPVDLSHLANRAGEGYGLADKVIDWVIVGGESGPGARPCRIEWVESIVDQCHNAGVPCFVKQLGSGTILDKGWHEQPVYSKYAERELRRHSQPFSNGVWAYSDSKGGNPEEWPIGLRVRQFPVVPS